MVATNCSELSSAEGFGPERTSTHQWTMKDGWVPLDGDQDPVLVQIFADFREEILGLVRQVCFSIIHS